MKRYLPFVIIAVVLVGAIGAGMFMFRTAQPKPSVSPTPAGSPAGTPTITTAKGAVIIEEFGDYQCPPCGALHPELKKIKSEYGDRIRFIFYHFPLTQIHKNALDAAHAAVAAGLQGRFWEMHDKLYDNQKSWSEVENLRPIAVGFAGQLGLNVEQFMRDMEGPKVDSVVLADVRRGESMGVNGTPTLFIDGQLIDSENLTIDVLRNEIDKRLSVRR